MTATGVVSSQLGLGLTLTANSCPYRLWRSSECLSLQRVHGKWTRICSCRSYLKSPIRLSPVDAILTRMGAYDNMFSSASTFKVELDEWWVYPDVKRELVADRADSCKILRDATPRSFVILDGAFLRCLFEPFI